MVDSRVFPDLERKPGGPDNWVEATGGLPDYIERIAKHLHYEKGMSISRAIATAVNTVKRWAAGGLVAEHGTTMRVNAQTQALAAKALAEWEAKKAAARGSARTLSHDTIPSRSIDLAEATVSLDELVARVSSISDPTLKVAARRRLLDLAMTKDGRKSFKRQGKWGHGFVPLDAQARESKAKGSPIAAKRINRLFGGASTGKKRTEPKTPKPGTLVKSISGQERAQSVGQLRNARIVDAKPTQKVKPAQLEVSRGRRPGKRSEKAWEKIPDAQKTIRNGKRYVLTTFNGKQQLTEWTGNPQNADPAAPNLNDRILTNISPADLAKLTTGAIRRLLEVKGTPDHVRKALNKELTKRENEGIRN